jgi:hypothetical protein
MTARKAIPLVPLALASLLLITASCVRLHARDLRDIGVPSVKCTSTDGTAHCVCYQKCISEASDCRCAEE